MRLKDVTETVKSDYVGGCQGCFGDRWRYVVTWDTGAVSHLCISCMDRYEYSSADKMVLIQEKEED